ncbi:hypothetical protein AB0A84_13585 [Streptomyces albidoflavus]|uniref:hypothetical protein n=1 Tax=Streptomyces albidoflavus TaxID=1886 RepID=UPI0033E46BB5
MSLRIRGVALPERVERTFWPDGEVLRTEPPAGPGAAREVEPVVDGGWLVPGLVDVHTHPGAEQPEDGFDEAALRRHLEAHRDAGVLLVRRRGRWSGCPAGSTRRRSCRGSGRRGAGWRRPGGSSPAWGGT